jgi:hypothetical protein
MQILAVLAVVPLLLSSGLLQAAEPRPPGEQFAGRPNRLADIPAGWATTRPLRLQICFNLKYPVNSPEADQFLETMQRTITAMPFGVKVRIERPITPEKFAYCGSLSFRDWRANREYETSDVFLKYYREQWKPAVTEATEQLLVLDEANSPP